MPPIPGEWLIQAGPYGLLALAVFMIFMGWLVPRSTVRGVERAMRRLEQERDQWQAVALKAMGHADALMPVAQITAEFTKTLSDAATAADERRPS